MVVATVTIAESNGVTPTVTNSISNLNMTSADEINSSSSGNPVTAANRSYQKWIRYYLAAINTSNKIDNFQVWLTPIPSTTGVSYVTNLQTASPPDDAFQTPATANEDGSLTDQTMPTTDPLAWNIGVGSANGGLSANGTYSDYIVIQLVTTGSTPPGNLPTKTIHFQYDEQ